MYSKIHQQVFLYICVFFIWKEIPALRMTINLGGFKPCIQTPKRTIPRSGGKCGAFGTGVSWWPAGGESGVVGRYGLFWLIPHLSHTYPKIFFVWCSFTDCVVDIQSWCVSDDVILFQCRVSFVDSSTLLKWSFGLTHSNCVLGHFVPCAKEHSTAVADVACWPECVNSPVSEAGVWDGCWGSPARLWHC